MASGPDYQYVYGSALNTDYNISISGTPGAYTPYDQVVNVFLPRDNTAQNNPLNTSNNPTVLMLNASGFRYADPNLLNLNAAQLAKSGFAVFVAGYRGNGTAPGNPTAPVTSTFPMEVDDVVSAAVWVFNNAAQFNGDNTGIHIIGGSAGGSLAAIATSKLLDLGYNIKTCQILSSNTDWWSALQSYYAYYSVVALSSQINQGTPLTTINAANLVSLCDPTNQATPSTKYLNNGYVPQTLPNNMGMPFPIAATDLISVTGPPVTVTGATCGSGSTNVTCNSTSNLQVGMLVSVAVDQLATPIPANSPSFANNTFITGIGSNSFTISNNPSHGLNNNTIYAYPFQYFAATDFTGNGATSVGVATTFTLGPNCTSTPQQGTPQFIAITHCGISQSPVVLNPQTSSLPAFCPTVTVVSQTSNGASLQPGTYITSINSGADTGAGTFTLSTPVIPGNGNVGLVGATLKITNPIPQFTFPAYSSAAPQNYSTVLDTNYASFPVGTSGGISFTHIGNIGANFGVIGNPSFLSNGSNPARGDFTVGIANATVGSLDYNLLNNIWLQSYFASSSPSYAASQRASNCWWNIYNSTVEEIPLQQPYLLAQALSNVGTVAELTIVPGSTHAYSLWQTSSTATPNVFNALVEFIRQRN